MLKKLNFDLKFFNYSNEIINLYSYHSFIKELFHNPYLYYFTINNTFFIHLVDTKGIVFYNDTLCFTSINECNNINTIVESYEKLSYNLEIFFNSNKGDTFIVFVSTNNVSHIDISHSVKCINESTNELEKMYRDISWFKDEPIL